MLHYENETIFCSEESGKYHYNTTDILIDICKIIYLGDINTLQRRLWLHIVSHSILLVSASSLFSVLHPDIACDLPILVFVHVYPERADQY